MEDTLTWDFSNSLALIMSPSKDANYIYNAVCIYKDIRITISFYYDLLKPIFIQK